MALNDDVNYYSPSVLDRTHFAISVREVALLLIVFGMLCGGLLQTREVWRQHQARILMDKIAEVQAAWMAFKDTYGQWPGDFNSPHALWVNAPETLGNGNGRLDGVSEFEAVFKQLYQAGYLTHKAGLGVDKNSENYPEHFVMDNGFGGLLSIVAVESGYAVHLGSGVPAAVLSALDTRFDDGKALTGRIRDWQSQGPGACQMHECHALALLPGTNRSPDFFRAAGLIRPAVSR